MNISEDSNLENSCPELHAFTYDFQKVCATVFYVRCKDKRSHYKCNILFAKTRLNSCKEISIIRLELLAIFIGEKAIEFVRKETKLNF